jgi:pimeloyl-ACP methyl ester carboxylesterase
MLPANRSEKTKLTAFPPARRIALPEVTLSIHEVGSGPAVVLCHGFPELAFSWRHQVAALAGAGFHAIVPDQRGYADSDAPDAIEDYDLVHLSDDLAALLDALGIEKAVFAGHDWGGFVAWAMPVRHPDRCLGVIGVNTPYIQFPTTPILRRAFGDDEKLYILWFQEPGVAEEVLDRSPRLVFERLMRRGVPPREGGLLGDPTGDANPFRNLEKLEVHGETLLSDDELDTYARAFEKSGFRGPVNWYRNIDRNSERVPGLGAAKLDLPCLQITAAWDPALPPRMAAGMPALCSDLEMHQIDACGHWTQQERPEELSHLMVDWLKRRFR